MGKDPSLFRFVLCDRCSAMRHCIYTAGDSGGGSDICNLVDIFSSRCDHRAPTQVEESMILIPAACGCRYFIVNDIASTDTIHSKFMINSLTLDII